MAQRKAKQAEAKKLRIHSGGEIHGEPSHTSPADVAEFLEPLTTPEPEALVIDPVADDVEESGVAPFYMAKIATHAEKVDPLAPIRDWAQSLREWQAKRPNGAILTEVDAHELDRIIIALEGHLA